ncbi:hypothetical protein [Rhodococcus koreensis]
MMRTVLVIFIAALMLCTATGRAHADEFDADKDADLGPAATTGQIAYDGFDDRARSLHLSMACGNEFEFMRGFVLASRFGKGNDDPATADVDEKDLSKWPVTLMLGKAALLADPKFQQPSPQSDGTAPGCNGWLGTESEVRNSWAPLAKGPAFETVVQLVNRVYGDWFSSADDSESSPCSSIAYDGEIASNKGVFVRLTPSCMARQIRVVMSDPNHGPWKWKDGKIIPELPGTDPKDLPCLSEWKVGIDGYTGDWDMAVIEYTRLAHLLYAVGTTRSSMDFDGAAALEVLNTRFLTLRSSPDQGATAREGFHLAASCGNSPNQFGSALDTVRGTGDDPGIGRYSEDGKDALGGTSFWEDLLRFLAILAIVAALIAAAAVLGFISAIGSGIGIVQAIAAGTAIVLVLGTITFFSASVQETENHLLMQNSSRYLKNKLMMAELSRQGHRDEFDTIAELNEELRIWLLERMQRIAEEDFIEYNSKPYGRLSHFSLLNLIDFACDIRWDYTLSGQMQQANAPCDAKDRAIVDAAAAVFDLSAAKAAVGSLEGRRLVPYRRLAGENKKYDDGRSLLELVGGADTMLGALQVWTGQMRYAPSGKATSSTFGQLVFYSTSNYRPDPMILDVAVNKSTPRTQQYVHDTGEAYTSGDGWLITAGGDDERAANGLESPLFPTIYSFSPTNDRGVGVPTTLMTDAPSDPSEKPPYSRVQEFLRFDGSVVEWGKGEVSHSDNNCLAGAFACGLRPRTPLGFDATCTTPIADKFVAIDSILCPQIGAPDDPSRGIYIAFYDHNGEWGFFEVVQRNAFASIDDFIARVRDRNRDHMSEWGALNADDAVTYIRTDGLSLEFTPEDEDFGAGRRACGVVNYESDSRFTISDVPESQAQDCRSVGRRIVIDLDDAEHPVRKAEYGPPLAALY